LRTPPKMMTDDTFAKRLVEYREKNHIGQSELAGALGIPKSSLCFYEKGRSLPSLDKAYEIAERLGVSLDYLVGRDEFGQDSISTVGDVARLIKRLCDFDCVFLKVGNDGKPVLAFSEDRLNELFKLQLELDREYETAEPDNPIYNKYLRSREDVIQALILNLDHLETKQTPTPEYLIQRQNSENSKRRQYKGADKEKDPSDNIVNMPIPMGEDQDAEEGHIAMAANNIDAPTEVHKKDAEKETEGA